MNITYLLRKMGIVSIIIIHEDKQTSRRKRRWHDERFGSRLLSLHWLENVLNQRLLGWTSREDHEKSIRKSLCNLANDEFVQMSCSSFPMKMLRCSVRRGPPKPVEMSVAKVPPNAIVPSVWADDQGGVSKLGGTCLGVRGCSRAKIVWFWVCGRDAPTSESVGNDPVDCSTLYGLGVTKTKKNIDREENIGCRVPVKMWWKRWRWERE